jgi:hypothetical protein
MRPRDLMIVAEAGAWRRSVATVPSTTTEHFFMDMCVTYS